MRKNSRPRREARRLAAEARQNFWNGLSLEQKLAQKIDQGHADTSEAESLRKKIAAQ